LTDWEPDGQIESPSGIEAPDCPRGVPMNEEAIADTIDAFVRAAVAAKQLGFDTLELHGAHGYLIDLFFWSGTNQRTDRYGGNTIAERSRFA
ncbi:12-oxophytodienoate reductase, partial [Rhizobium ruizarguesonis]